MDATGNKKQDSDADNINLRKGVPSNGLSKQSPSQAQRLSKKPLLPTRPKPAIAQKPVNIGNKQTAEKRQSFKRQTSGPKPPVPSRPAVSKKPSEKTYNDQKHIVTSKIEGPQESHKEAREIVSATNQGKECKEEELEPLLRTMSGPVRGIEAQQREKSRSISLQCKENDVPKPIPKPKPARRPSNDAQRPIPPPRSKQKGKPKAIAQPVIDGELEEKKSMRVNADANKDSKEFNMEKASVMKNHKEEAMTDNSVSNKGELSILIGNKDSVTKAGAEIGTKSVVDDSEKVEESDKNCGGGTNEVLLNGVHPVVETFSIEESKLSNDSKTNETMKIADTKIDSKRRNPYENVPAFNREENQTTVKTPEISKRPLITPYESVPVLIKVNDTDGGSTDLDNRNNIEDECEESDSEDGNDYENIPHNRIDDKGTINHNDDIDHRSGSDDGDYENADVIGEVNRSNSQLDGQGSINQQLMTMTADFDSSDFAGDSSPLNFGRLRIDADDIDSNNTYESVPRNCSLVAQTCEGVGETVAHLPQLESLSQDSYYQSPSASPQLTARRNLFGNGSAETSPSQSHKRIRRPPPEPPKMEKDLRLRAKSNDVTRLEKAQSSSAKLLPAADCDESIYVVPKGGNEELSSLRGDSGGETDSLTSYQSAQSSVASDFTHHIYKEPSIHSDISGTEPQEYSVPGAASLSSEYVDPDNLGKGCDADESMDVNRQSYTDSESSVSTRGSIGMNIGNNIDTGYESVGEIMQPKPRGDSTDNHSGPEYVDMSPMKDEKREDDGEYLSPMVMEEPTKRIRKPPVRPAPPAPIRPAKRPDDLPLPPVPAISVPEDVSKLDSLDGRYERIQSLRRGMGLPPTVHGEEFDSDSESEEESPMKEEEDEEKKCEAKEGDGKPKSKLYHIAHEILTTERTFVNALRLVCDEFAVAAKNMIEKDPSSLPKHAFSQMFDDVELIYDLDKRFLQDLEDRMKDWDSHNKIGDIVRKYGHFLKMYTNYIRGYDRAMAVFQECCQKMPKFTALVKEYERKPSFQNLKITSYMLKPIQRIPSYRLLLVDYLKHLPSDSNDYQDVSNGLGVVSEVAKQINESMKEGDKFQLMLKLQARIINSREIVKPGRYLIKEGILNKLSRKEAQERMFFLLTDCLLYCEHAPVSNQYKLREELPLARMTLDVPENIDFNKEFTIISTKRSFTVVASSTEERDDWATAIQNAIDDASRRIGTFTIKLEHNEKTSQLVSPTRDIGQIAPKWVPDARATMCSICCRRFTTYNRRHHCRACGEIVCKDCSSYEAPLPYLDYDVARVCEKCYGLLYETLVEDETPPNNADEKSKGQNPENTILKRSKSAMSSKFKVVKKMKRDRAMRKTLPSTLTEVSAQEQQCNISGYLFITKKRKQKKRWFVLKEHALYSYKAPSDPAAQSTLAVLGYNINVTGDFDAGDFIFQLEHSGLKEPYVYKAESRESADMWVNALRKASSLQSS